MLIVEVMAMGAEVSRVRYAGIDYQVLTRHLFNLTHEDDKTFASIHMNNLSKRWKD